jgi:hypothetical protein
MPRQQSQASQGHNARVAALLREKAAILEAQNANPFRVNAYRQAADTVANLASDVGDLFQQSGIEGLIALPHIGEGIAGAIAEILTAGRWSQLERLRGTLDPVAAFRAIPGIGPDLARQIHDTLHVDTLEALEAACNDGRIETVPGIGQRRAAAIKAALAQLLSQRRVRGLRGRVGAAEHEPPVDLLLAVDREYRDKAAQGKLRTIAPKRFNPEGKAWLPVLQTDRGAWHFTALYSNTAKAHELGRTRDWVVLYFYDADHVERQRTVVTEARGPLAGRRVVRGREGECQTFYAAERAGTTA